MKKLLWLLLPALAAYGAWDLVREVRGAWTSDYSRTYSRAVGQTMSRAFDSLNLSGRGVRIGVLDAGFGGFRTDRWTRGLHVAAWRDFTGGDRDGILRRRHRPRHEGLHQPRRPFGRYDPRAGMGARSIILRKPTAPKWSLAPRSGS